MKILILFISLISIQNTLGKKIDTKELRCLVCRTTIEEIQDVISAVDPKKMVDIGSYRLDGSGNSKTRSVPLVRSEIFLSELLDTICDKMDDYVRATWKSNGELTLLRIMTKDGKMNSDMSNVDIIQDDDLNKSLKFYCEGIVGENEDAIIKLYAENETNIDVKVCSDISSICNDVVEQEDYAFAGKEEL